LKGDVIAKRYAKALYELGQEESLEQKFLDELTMVVSVIQESSEFKSIMESPLYDITLKKKILQSIASELSLSTYMANLLNIMLDKDRFEYVDQLLDTYKEILNEIAGRVRANVISAIELDEVQQNKIAEVLSKLMQKEVAVEVSVDQSLIGGIVAEVQGLVYDGSIKTQFSKVKQSLKGEI